MAVRNRNKKEKSTIKGGNKTIIVTKSSSATTAFPKKVKAINKLLEKAKLLP